MYTVPPKKMIIINILDILKKYSDMDHTLTQQEIVEILKKEYYMDVDRKTVKRNLMNLADVNSGIEYTEITRTGENGKETSICTNWYLTREFDDSELRLLIDSLLFNKHIPYSQCKMLIDKLKSLSNVYFDKKVRHVCNLPEKTLSNKELFYTIDVLDEAISKNKKVEFTYNSYGTDKKLHPNKEGKYIINPYQMVATNGRYYLICNYDKYDNITNYRVDRITDIRILNEPIKPVKKLKGGEIDLPHHMAEHIYMFAGESIRAKFKVKTALVDQVLDWFGEDVEFSEANSETCVAAVKVNREAFFCWAMQYGMHIEVLEPADMRAKIIDAVKTIGERYAK